MRSADAAILIAAIALFWSVYRAHKDPNFTFNLLDLLMDGGRVSKTSFAFMTTLLLTSWIMLRITLDGKLTEGYFGAYGAMWVGPLVAKMFAAPSPPGTTTTDTSSKTTTTTENP